LGPFERAGRWAFHRDFHRFRVLTVIDPLDADRFG
jgi:hypothetical protein